MLYITVETALTRKPKFKRLIRVLKIDVDKGLALLVRLWSNVLELAEDGDITTWSAEDIAEYSGWEKDPNFLYKTLLEAKWVEKNGKFTLIHDWLDHAGKYLKSKYRTSNPNKIKEIWKKHKTVFSQSLDDQLDGLKTDKIRGDKITLPKSTLPKIILDKLRKHYLLLKHWDEMDLKEKDYQRIHHAIKEFYKTADGKVDLMIGALTWVSQKRYSEWTIETAEKKFLDFKSLPATEIMKYIPEDAKQSITELTKGIGKDVE